MLVINETDLNDNMEGYLDMVGEEGETILVTGKDEKNIVIISEKNYHNMVENLYVMANKTNYDWLMESKEQLESGHCL